jgi:hypothetical protein
LVGEDVEWIWMYLLAVYVAPDVAGIPRARHSAQWYSFVLWYVLVYVLVVLVVG